MASSESFQTPEVLSKSNPTPVGHSDLRHHLREALGLLLQAYEYAAELERDPWELAVELHVLRVAKATNSDLRWLAAHGYIEHAVETTAVDADVRHFRRTTLLTFNELTCFVLTRSGAAVAREACSSESRFAVAKTNGSVLVSARSHELPSRPTWDQQRRQLRVGAQIVKEFKLPSANQETILMALEEEGWPPRIDDPLPQTQLIDPRRRLHDTIKALNRNQKQELIRFQGDGSGEGIRWELTLRTRSDWPSTIPVE